MRTRVMVIFVSSYFISLISLAMKLSGCTFSVTAGVMGVSVLIYRSGMKYINFKCRLNVWGVLLCVIT